MTRRLFVLFEIRLEAVFTGGEFLAIRIDYRDGLVKFDGDPRSGLKRPC
jgi:hypothetical protein